MSTSFGSAILLSGLLVAGAVAPAPAGAQDAGKFCEVTIDRTHPDGTFYITRQTLENGDCICYVQTGPKPQATKTEEAILELRREQRCEHADATIAVPAGYAAAPVQGSVGKFTLIGILGGAAAIAGVAAALSDDSPASP